MFLVFNNIYWVGHGGGSPDVKAIVAYDLDSGVFVAIAANAAIPVEALANRLIKVVQNHPESP
ncbi:MAG: hypothetical protein WBB01_07505 [Phormidesmis sp.]